MAPPRPSPEYIQRRQRVERGEWWLYKPRLLCSRTAVQRGTHAGDMRGLGLVSSDSAFALEISMPGKQGSMCGGGGAATPLFLIFFIACEAANFLTLLLEHALHFLNLLFNFKA